MFRAAFLSDLHFRAGAGLAEPTRITTWIADDLRLRVGDGLVLDAILLGGDIHHTASRPDDRKAVARLVVALAALAPVVIAYGNHDRAGDLDLLASLATVHPVTVFSEPGVWVHPDGRGAVAVLPWLTGIAETWQRGMSQAELAAAEKQALVHMLTRLGAFLAVAPGEHLLMGHCMIEGALPGAGQPERTGKEFVVGGADLAIVPAAAYLLGHVHTAQSWGKVIYAGSPHRTAFGEVEQKNYLLVGVENGQAAVERVRTPATPMVLLEDIWEARDAAGVAHEGWAYGRAEAARKSVDGAEVRFRYDVAAAARQRAREAAEQARVSLLAAGARKVKLDPRVLAETRVRAAGIAEAMTLSEKLDVYLRTLVTPPASAEVVRRAHALLAGLPSELTASARGTGGMRLHRLTLTGMKPFPDGVDLDIDALPGDIIAVRGENGEGKSTLFGAWPAALFGRMPEGSDLGAFALADEACVEVAVDIGGETWTLQQHPRRGQAFALRPDMTPVDKRGGVRAFKAWSEEHVLPSAVLFSSIFCPQKSTGLLGMGPAERKRALAAAFGGDRLEAVAQVARARAKAERDRLKAVAPLLADHEARLRALPLDLEACHAAAEERARAVEAALAAGRLDHAALAEEEQNRTAWSKLDGERLAAESTRETIQTQMAEGEALRGRAERIRHAAGRMRDLLAELDEVVRTVDATERREEGARGMKSGATIRAHHAREDLAELDDRIAKLDLALSALPSRLAAEESARLLPILRSDLAVAEGNLTSHEQTLSEMRRAIDAAKDERISMLRAVIEQATQEHAVQRVQGILQGGLAEDDRRAREETGATGALLDKIEAERTIAVRTRALISTAHAEQARLTEIVRLSEERTRATKNREKRAVERDAAEADIAAFTDQITVLGAANEEAAARLAALRAQIAELKPIAAEESALKTAEAIGATLAPALAHAEETIRVSLETLASLPAPPPSRSVPAPDLGVLEEAARAADRAAHELVLKGRIRATLVDDLAALKTEQAERGDERDAWALLDRAFGVNGIQALEIDAAGPGLTATINDLLHGCFGSRWTVRIDTSREGGDGQLVEACPILVWDAEDDGPPRDASKFSEGQQAILGRAIALGIVMVVCGRADAQAPTLVFDETGAGVSEENVEPFMALLRRAARTIGAGKVFLINHSDAMSTVCDVVLRVGGGKVEVETK